MNPVETRRKKRSQIHEIRHLRGVEESNGKEKVIASESRFKRIDTAQPARKIALFWRVAESFHAKECISDSIGEERVMSSPYWL